MLTTAFLQSTKESHIENKQRTWVLNLNANQKMNSTKKLLKRFEFRGGSVILSEYDQTQYSSRQLIMRRAVLRTDRLKQLPVRYGHVELELRR